MLYRVVLALSVCVIPALGIEVCLCTDSDVVIRKIPSPTASVIGKLDAGTCLNGSQFDRTGQWLKVVDGIQTGYLVESENMHQRTCPDVRSIRATNYDALYCRYECPPECCGVHSSSSAHDGHFHTVVSHASDHVCDKVSVVQAVALQVPENCSSHNLPSFTSLMTQQCKAPASVSDWVAGLKVSTSCATLPMYSPVATFNIGSLHDIISGVFVGCVSNHEFKIITSSCGMPPQVMHISSHDATFNHFYQMKW